MLKTICYISDSNESESLENIKRIYAKAKQNNLKRNITGILIYQNGNFLQVLEGDEEHVDTTYEKIKFDSRHKNIIKVINNKIEQRIFEDYNFGFSIVKSSSEFNQLNEYLKWLKQADNKIANKVISMVENFISVIG
ncbi:BLUF domain-containing protein [Algibacter luteus]|uniref:Sensors of blue-light using FAD n=1 Tax=Algibacter luteus TaxID=1178825 RepID=A0A1M6G6L8_9FLAO|nr:BLUF domain-containing protein [Algibacter luteus]SHJ05626.1 Sensors of blue-light using FAD [Algibacter luteus]